MYSKLVVLMWGAAAVAVSAGSAVAGAPGRAETLRAARSSIERRLAALQSVAASFHEKIDYTPSVRMLRALVATLHRKQPNITMATFNQGFRFKVGRFRYYHGLAKYQIGYSRAGWRAAKRRHVDRMFCTTYERQREEVLTETPFGTTIGTINGKAQFPPMTVIAEGLGLRVPYGGWMKAKDITKRGAVSAEGGRLEMRHGKRTRCRSTWRFRETALGLELVRVTAVWPTSAEEVKCHQFRKIDGLALPRRIDYTARVIRMVPKKGMTLNESMVLSKIRYDVRPSRNTPVSFRMVWPKGCTVLDTRIHETFFIKTRARTLSDARIFALSKKWDMRKPGAGR